MNKCYLLLGGNKGDKKAILADACNLIEKSIGTINNKSSLYETEAWGFSSNEKFINQAIEVSSILNAARILKEIHIIEKSLGRVRSEQQYSSRLIDIDILLFNDEIICKKNLIIPHPRLHKRMFALVPLNEIASLITHPILKKSIIQLLIDCEDNLGVQKKAL